VVEQSIGQPAHKHEATPGRLPAIGCDAARCLQQGKTVIYSMGTRGWLERTADHRRSAPVAQMEGELIAIMARRNQPALAAHFGEIERPKRQCGIGVVRLKWTIPELRRVRPPTALAMMAARIVRFLVGEGVKQSLDIGSGIPTAGSVHRVAQRADPEPQVGYADVEPEAVTLSRPILEGLPDTIAIQGDARRREDVINHREYGACWTGTNHWAC